MSDALSRVFLRANLMLFGAYRLGLVRNETETVGSFSTFAVGFLAGFFVDSFAVKQLKSSLLQLSHLVIHSI